MYIGMDMGLGWGKTWLNMFNQFYAKLIIELTTIIKIITTYRNLAKNIKCMKKIRCEGQNEKV